MIQVMSGLYARARARAGGRGLCVRVRMTDMRRLGVLVLLTTLTALVPAYAPGPPAAATASQERARAVESVTFTGRGFGHGKGLSQHGALGRANDGQTYRKIIEFYYPGVSWGEAGGKVRVLVTGDTSRDVVVLDEPGLTVRALKSGRTWTPRVDARRWRITPVAGGRSVVAYKTARWHDWRTVDGEAEFSAAGRPLTLVTPDGKVAYRGALRSAAPEGADRDRDTVNVVSLDGYLKGVVPREVPALWPDHAVRAQAVAARTYAAFERADAPSLRHYQICDTSACQVYGGHSAEHPGSNAAIAATAGEVRVARGAPIFAQFSSSNGGWSVKGQFDYLPAQEDTFDFDTYSEWSRTIAAEDITRHWTEDLGDLVSVSVTERDGNGSYGGRALTVRVEGTKLTKTVNGSTFAGWLGLKSTLFRVD